MEKKSDSQFFGLENEGEIGGRHFSCGSMVGSRGERLGVGVWDQGQMVFFVWVRLWLEVEDCGGYAVGI
jgi:hypothetical protein